MKKLMSLALTGLLAATVAHAASNEVYSVNVVGFQKLQISPSTYYLSACNFEAGSSNTLQDIFGTDMLAQNDNYLRCDRVLIYDNATQTYQAWAQWTDGVFYKANTMTEWNQSIAGNPEVPVGAGFFIVCGIGGSNTITYVGDVVMNESNSVVLKPGFQVVSYPFSSDIALQSTSLRTCGAIANENYLSADRVMTYNAGTYQTYALYTDGIWYKANSMTEWNQSIPATNTIKAGESVFYRRVGSSNLTWTETNKYLQSLQN